MKKILMILILLPIVAVAEDKVISELIKENDVLQKKIELNNQMINLREKSVTSINDIKPMIKKNNSEIFFGFENVNLTENSNEIAPTIGYAKKFENKMILGASYGRLQSDNFPGVGIQTITNIYQIYTSYNYSTSWNFDVRPILGYVEYHVNSPDAGNTDSISQSNYEIDEINKINDRSRIFAGVSIVKDINTNWDISFRADISKSASMFLSYKL